MTDKPISDLRRRMLEDMAVRRFSEKTQHDYIRHIEALPSFLGRSPDTATPRTCADSRCTRWSRAPSRRR